MDETKLSRTLRALYTKLLPGESVSRYELHKCFEDSQTKLRNVRDRISDLRVYLRPYGLEIVCEINPGKQRGIFYRMVRLMASPYDGKR